MSSEAVLLVDNGSLRPAAVRSLRELCRRLRAGLDREVVPVSIMHSDRIDPAELDGRPAEIYETALRLRLARGIRKFLVIPLFFGPSRAITKFIPLATAVVRAEFHDLEVRLAPCLVDRNNPSDTRVAQILRDQVLQTIRMHRLVRPPVVTVDHGTPIRPVAEVRDFIGEQLKELLGDRIGAFSVASMERRDGPEYDFNEPLLSRVLRQPPFAEGPVVVSMMFLNPGRHAGVGGDVASICDEARTFAPRLRPHMTDLVAAHPLLLSILRDRYREALNATPLGMSPSRAL